MALEVQGNIDGTPYTSERTLSLSTRDETSRQMALTAAIAAPLTSASYAKKPTVYAGDITLTMSRFSGRGKARMQREEPSIASFLYSSPPRSSKKRFTSFNSTRAVKSNVIGTTATNLSTITVWMSDPGSKLS